MLYNNNCKQLHDKMCFSGVPGIPRQGGGGGRGQATWTSKGGCVQWRIPDLHQQKRGGRKNNQCVREAHRARVSALLIRVGSRGPP